MEVPLVPLDDAVCFPRTALHLSLSESVMRSLARQLALAGEAGQAGEPQLDATAVRHVGVVLLEPAADDQTPDSERKIFHEGCLARLVEAVETEDGRYQITLEGERRFSLVEEMQGGDPALPGPCRRARVRPLPEDQVSDHDPAVVELRDEISRLALRVASEVGDRFPLDRDELDELASGAELELLVNGMAAELDVPATRKLSLLAVPLVDRAEEVAGILRSRAEVLDLLRPFRPREPEDAAELN